MSDTPAIAVVGAGLIGRTHVEVVSRCARLSAVVDPSPEAENVARAADVPWFSDLETFLATERADGIVLATPNQLHVEQGLACVEAGVPMLIEKPISNDVASAETLVNAAEAKGVEILVGHHRRHNPLVAAAKQVIASGRLGDVIAATGQFWLYKPDDYFEPSWRRSPGAGPVFINLIHDIDLMRHFCGDVEYVQALESRNARGFDVEDTMAVLIRFTDGALGTVSVSDTVSAPWSWEFTSAENPIYPNVQTSCYRIGGTHGSLSVPDLTLWRHDDTRSWWEPISGETVPFEVAPPLERQLDDFVAVIRGEKSPLVSGREGLESLRVIEAIKLAASTEQGVAIDTMERGES